MLGRLGRDSRERLIDEGDGSDGVVRPVDRDRVPKVCGDRLTDRDSPLEERVERPNVEGRLDDRDDPPNERDSPPVERDDLPMDLEALPNDREADPSDREGDPNDLEERLLPRDSPPPLRDELLPRS
jgi:hypothetical protein